MDAITPIKKIKILIVEDQETIRKVYRTILESAGYGIIEADDGAKGWSWAQTACPDLIITDLMMPVMDGYELIQKIRSDPETRAIPVIVLSMRGEDSNIKKALSLGATGFLTKGYVPPKTIVDQIRSALQSARDGGI